MRILITGGAGFIGLHLARELGPEHDLVCLDNFLPQVHRTPESSRQKFPGQVVVGDVCDERAWRQVGKCDVVVHLAAETGTGQSMYEQERYRRVNVGGTETAATFARSWGVPLIAMSSRAVYGEGRTQCVEHGIAFGEQCCGRALPAPSHEDDPHLPVSVYGESKSLGERSVIDLAAEVGTTIIRPQNVIGPGQALHNPYTGVLAAFLARLREARPLTVYGDGSATRDFIHVSDVAKLIAWCVLEAPTTDGVRVLNSGSGIRMRLDDLARAAIAGSPVPNTVIEHLAVHRAGDIEHACADLSRSQRLGAPLAVWSPRDAVIAFIQESWSEPVAQSVTWDRALAELDERGLTS